MRNLQPKLLSPARPTEPRAIPGSQRLGLCISHRDYRSTITAPAILFVLLLAFALCATAQVTNYRDIKFPPLPKFEIPKPTVFTLNNGLQVFLMEDHELPLIQVTARVRTGSNYEPAEKTGLASLMGAVQRT